MTDRQSYPLAAMGGGMTGQQHPSQSQAQPSAVITGVSAAGGAPPSLTDVGEESQIEGLVLAYLKRRGYKNAEEALRAEASRAQRPAAAGSSGASDAAAASAAVPPPPAGSVDVHTLSADLSLDQHTHLVRQLLLYSSAECTPDAYSGSFEHLKRWIADCLHVYRAELSAVLWPLYAHVFIQLVHRGFPQDAHRFLARFRADHESLHKSELHTFQNLISDSDLHKCEIIRWFLQRKVEVPMSAYSHQLLIAFLEQQRYLLLLKIINEHMHIRVTSRKPLQLESDSLPSSSALLATAGSVSALNPLAVANLNNTPIRWGMLPELAELHAEAASKLKAKLRDSQLTAKMQRLKEEKEKAEAAEAARKAKEAADSKEAAAANDDEEDGEAPKKKAKTEDVADGAAAAAADTDMADADETAAAAAGEGAAASAAATAAAASDKSKKSKKKDPTLAAADARDPLKETKEERDAIERTVKQQIKMPEAMPVPKKEDASAIVQLPPIPVDARARYLADLHFRHKLSPSSLPSICLYTFLNSLHSVNGVAISPDGALVSCAMSDSTVRVYDLRDPQVRLSTNPHANPALRAEGKDDETRALENSIYADGQEATAGAFSTITSSLLPHRRFADESTKLPYSKLVGHSGPVYATALSPEGQYMLSASEDATVRLWHLETKKNLVVYKGHNYPIWDVAFGPLGYYFATASHDHTARLWSTNHISPLRLFVGHSSDVDVVRFHPNSNYVATGSADSTARLWDIQTGECVRVLVGHTGGVRSLAMDPEGRYAATGGDDGRVLVWDLGTGRQVTAYNAHTAPVTALDYSADAEVLASGSLDCTLRLMEPSRPHRTTPLHTYHTKRTPVHFLKFTPRNVLLAAGIFHA